MTSRARNGAMELGIKQLGGVGQSPEYFWILSPFQTPEIFISDTVLEATIKRVYPNKPEKGSNVKFTM